MSHRPPKSSSYDSVMYFYLAVGAFGLLFVAGSALSDFGWVEALIRAIFGEQSGPVLESLYTLGILLTFAFGFYLFVGWIPAIWIMIRYRNRWPIWAPSAFFLFIEMLLAATLQSNWSMESSYEWAIGVVVGLYFFATLLIGLQMLSRRDRPNGAPNLRGS